MLNKKSIYDVDVKTTKNFNVYMKDGKSYKDVVYYTDHDCTDKEYIESLCFDAKPTWYYKDTITIRGDYKQYNLSKDKIDYVTVYDAITEKDRKKRNDLYKSIFDDDLRILSDYHNDTKDFQDYYKFAIDRIESADARIHKYSMHINSKDIFKKYCFDCVDFFKDKKTRDDLWIARWDDYYNEWLRIQESNKNIISHKQKLIDFNLS